MRYIQKFTFPEHYIRRWERHERVKTFMQPDCAYQSSYIYFILKRKTWIQLKLQILHSNCLICLLANASQCTKYWVSTYFVLQYSFAGSVPGVSSWKILKIRIHLNNELVNAANGTPPADWITQCHIALYSSTLSRYLSIRIVKAVYVITRTHYLNIEKNIMSLGMEILDAS